MTELGALAGLAGWLLELSSWGITALFILLAWEAFRFISFGSGEDKKSGWLFKKISGELPWTDEAKEIRSTKREKVTMMNTYLEEEEEKKLIEAAIEKTKDFEVFVEAVVSNGKFADKDERVKIKEPHFDDTKEAVDAAAKEIRRVKNRANRFRQAFDKFQQELEQEKGVKKSDPRWAPVEAKKNDMLKHNTAAEKELEHAEEAIKEIAKHATPLGKKVAGGVNFPVQWPGSSGVTIGQRLTLIQAELKKLALKLSIVKTHNDKAFEEIEGLIAEMKKAW